MLHLRHSQWVDIQLLLRLCEPLMNHFCFLKFNSTYTEIDSMLQSDISLRKFEGASSRIKNKSARPLEFLSNLYGIPYPFKINFSEGNEAPSFFPIIKSRILLMTSSKLSTIFLFCRISAKLTNKQVKREIIAIPII